MPIDSPESETPPAQPGKKPKDKTSDKPQKSSTRVRKPSDLQANIDEQNVSKEDLAIQALQKKLANALKKKNKSTLNSKKKLNAAKPRDIDRGSDIEDEDTPDEDMDVGPLSCSIYSKGPQIVSGAPKKLNSASEVRKRSEALAAASHRESSHSKTRSSSVERSPSHSDGRRSPLQHRSRSPRASRCGSSLSQHRSRSPRTSHRGSSPSQHRSRSPRTSHHSSSPPQHRYRSAHTSRRGSSPSIPRGNSSRASTSTRRSISLSSSRDASLTRGRSTKKRSRQEHSHSPSHKRQKLLIAKIRHGIKSGGRPNAGDYEEPACNILLDAAYDYSCQICAINPFPTSVEQHEMATSAWKKACHRAGKSFEFTARMKTVLTARGSKIRGMIKDTARTLVGPTYGFDRTNTPATKAKNHELYLALTKADSFHHKTPETRSQFAQHRIIYETVRITFFNDQEDLGAIFTSYFNPISLVTLAIVITAVDFCLKEWSTGEFIKAKFYEKAITVDYMSYLKKIQDWHGLAPETVTKMLAKMHTRLRRDAGASNSTSGGGIAIGLSAAEKELALKELEGHMGDTESEEE